MAIFVEIDRLLGIDWDKIADNEGLVDATLKRYSKTNHAICDLQIRADLSC